MPTATVAGLRSFLSAISARAFRRHAPGAVVWAVKETTIPAPVLSTTRYIQGLQCKKLLWHVYNARDLIPSVDEGTQAIFDQGHEVGLLAQTLSPGCIAVEGNIPFDQVVTRSRDLLHRRAPLFEAGFRHNHVNARADVLEPAGADSADGWNIVEVKSTTSVKDPHWDDLAVQKHCYEGAGLRIRHGSSAVLMSLMSLRRS